MQKLNLKCSYQNALIQCDTVLLKCQCFFTHKNDTIELDFCVIEKSYRSTKAFHWKNSLIHFDFYS